MVLRNIFSRDTCVWVASGIQEDGTATERDCGMKLHHRKLFIILIAGLLAIIVLIAVFAQTPLGCAPVGCGCDCAPDVDMPDLELPGGDAVPERDRGGGEGEDEIPMWVIIVPSLAVLGAGIGAAYYLGTRRR